MGPSVTDLFDSSAQVTNIENGRLVIEVWLVSWPRMQRNANHRSKETVLDNFIDMANLDLFSRCSGRIRSCPGEQYRDKQ